MITRTKVNLGENFGSSQLIKKNITSRGYLFKRIFDQKEQISSWNVTRSKRIFVLDGYRIERSVVST
jgi:hypothetical protein